VYCLEDQEEEAELCSRIVADGFDGDTAILYRMNAQSLHFERLFREKRIPFRLVGTTGFYSREEVKDAVAYLSLLANPNDEVRFRRVVNKPSRGIGESSVEKIVAEWRSGGTLIEASRRTAARLPARTRAGLHDFLTINEDLGSALPDTPLSELARVLISRTRLYELYKGRDRSDGTARSENLEEMVSDLASYGTGQQQLVRYLEDVALASPGDEKLQNDADTKVSLITIHNTKGLEFDRVIITGLEEQIFPHSSSDWGEPEELEEERRLFYVGITRAREKLVMTWCRRRRIFGRYSDMAPSRFLDEIPEGAAERVGENREAEAADDYPVGSGVYHDEYGPGVVARKWYTDDARARGGTLLVQVRFESGRVAKFLPKYTRLERISLSE
jgi:DNA helicase II / ATP-dependent DNA helicase PcrA